LNSTFLLVEGRFRRDDVLKKKLFSRASASAFVGKDILQNCPSPRRNVSSGVKETVLEELISDPVEV